MNEKEFLEHNNFACVMLPCDFWIEYKKKRNQLESNSQPGKLSRGEVMHSKDCIPRKVVEDAINRRLEKNIEMVNKDLVLMPKGTKLPYINGEDLKKELFG